MSGPKYGDFEFPTSFGFSGSATDRTTTTVRSHERKKPGFAKGGRVPKRAVLAGAAAAAAAAALMDKDKDEKKTKPSAVEHLRGDTRRKQMEELGLAHGGRARKNHGTFNRKPLIGK